VTETGHEHRRRSLRLLSEVDAWLRWPDGIARLGVVLVVAVTAGFGLAYTPRALDQLGDEASRNAALSFADREIAGGNSVIVDQIAAYEARALLPAGETYRVVTGGGLTEKTDLTLPFVDSWFRYFLMPHRPSGSARWIVCYGCDATQLGGRFVEMWHDDAGISIGRLES
jgi:hypothetical protein